MRHYVGIDVARGSLKDAAIRAREMRKKKKLKDAIFSCADLGSDVPGRKKTRTSKHLQKLLTWKLSDEALLESGPPEFRMERGGGISEKDRFDIVSIQFAIHYMMQTGKRARRFFHTVSQLLEIGGNLVFTTIDARVIIEHMMNLGHDYHFEDGKDAEFSEVVVEAGAGACKLKFQPDVVKKIIEAKSDGSKGEEELFGLEYTFTLVEGSDHAAGVGDAVNLPEWLTPIPVLVAIGKEAGLELEYAQNFHEFCEARKDPSEHSAAHLALYNMKVLNRNGTISKDEWSVSRLYAAMKFRKVRESTMVLEGDENEEEDDGDDDDEALLSEPEKPAVELDPIKVKKMYPMAMMKAKRAAGDLWNSFSKEKKEELTQIELTKLAAK
jgi:mRNA (guanine-N7-)-methyltransferase